MHMIKIKCIMGRGMHGQLQNLNLSIKIRTNLIMFLSNKLLLPLNPIKEKPPTIIRVLEYIHSCGPLLVLSLKKSLIFI